METNTTSTIVDKLRAAADLIAAHPDLPRPCVFASGSSGHVEISWHILSDDDTKDDQRAAALRIMRAVGGTWAKNAWGNRFDFEQERDGLKLEIYAHREQICERRVVGTEEVTVPAIEAQPERTEVREIVEWDCSPVLAEAVSS